VPPDADQTPPGPQVLEWTGGAGSPIEEAVLALARAWTNSQFYPSDHTMVTGQLAQAEATLSQLLIGGGELSIKQVDGDLVHVDQRLFQSRPAPAGFVGALSRRRAECVTFTRGLSTHELLVLCELLCTDVEELEDQGGLKQALVDSGCRHVTVDDLAVAVGGAGRGEGGGGGGFSGMTLTGLYRSAMNVVRDTIHAVRVGRQISVASTEAIVDELVTRVIHDRSAAISLACLKGHDEYTFAHCVHTALLSLALGEAMGLDEEELRQLGVAAMLHDVGKVFVPVEVIRKPGKLSDDEWQVMCRHPVDGAAVLLEYGELPVIAPAVALEHHMRVDLGGYPKPRAPRELCLVSMIVPLADVYDALTTYRPYRPPMLPGEAAAEMANTGANGQFEPRFLSWFCDMLGAYPPGTCLELDTGQCGVVCRSSPADEPRPDVCIVVEQDGSRPPEPYEVSLQEQRSGGRYRRSVARTIRPEERSIDPAETLEKWLRRPCDAPDGSRAAA